jgi:hypothetical protein
MRVEPMLRLCGLLLEVHLYHTYFEGGGRRSEEREDLMMDATCHRKTLRIGIRRSVVNNNGKHMGFGIRTERWSSIGVDGSNIPNSYQDFAPGIHT